MASFFFTVDEHCGQANITRRRKRPFASVDHNDLRPLLLPQLTALVVGVPGGDLVERTR